MARRGLYVTGLPAPALARAGRSSWPRPRPARRMPPHHRSAATCRPPHLGKRLVVREHRRPEPSRVAPWLVSDSLAPAHQWTAATGDRGTALPSGRSPPTDSSLRRVARHCPSAAAHRRLPRYLRCRCYYHPCLRCSRPRLPCRVEQSWRAVRRAVAFAGCERPPCCHTTQGWRS